MKNLFVFGTNALGENIKTTPVIKAFSSKYNIIFVPVPHAPMFEICLSDIPFLTYKDLLGRQYEEKKINNRKTLVLNTKLKHHFENSSWIAPNWQDVIFQDGTPLPGGIFKSENHEVFPELSYLPLCNRHLAMYGFSPTEDRLYISPINTSVNPDGVCFVNSGDDSRRLSLPTIEKLDYKLQDITVNFVGKKLPKEIDLQISGTKVTSRDSPTHEYTHSILKIISESKLIVGTDNGFLFTAMAMGKPTILLRSRGGHHGTGAREKKYRREMWGCMPLRYSNRPFFEKQDKLMCGFGCLNSIPVSSLPCIKNAKDRSCECLDYSEEDIDSLSQLIIKIFPEN
tara:strand:+ start:4577 stop:5599 length:1023 start_codon:yes stop_codon:yes gene_type:complete